MIIVEHKLGFINIAPLDSEAKFMDKFGPDYWWTKYGDHYDYILKHCKNLAPSPAIHVAFSTDDNGNIVKAVPMKDALLYLNTYNNGTTT